MSASASPLSRGPRRSLPVLLLPVLALPACGAAGGERAAVARPEARSARPVVLPDRDVELLLGARVRALLVERAVLGQPPGEAADLGQDLPRDLLDRVRCAGAACAVTIRTVAGDRRRLRYDVRTTAPRCVTAIADPQPPARLDPRTKAYVADPLAVAASADPACTGVAPADVTRVSRAAAVRGDGVAGVAAQDPRDPLVPRASAALLAGPIRAYRRHVVAELAGMVREVAAMRRAIARRDLRAARRSWWRADERYERIGAAYGAFGDLDAAINGRPGGLPGGVRSPRFAGLHRVELALFGRRSVRDASPAVAGLAQDVAALRRAVASGKAEGITPLDYALRAHEVLEDTLHLALPGVASPWASAALVQARANLEGTRVVLRTLRPLLRARDPQRLAAVDASVARLGSVLRRVAPAGTTPRWDGVGERDRQTVRAAVAGAAEQLAYVPALVDPRAPVARTNAFGLGRSR